MIPGYPTQCPSCGWEGATPGLSGWECARCRKPVRLDARRWKLKTGPLVCVVLGAAMVIAGIVWQILS